MLVFANEWFPQKIFCWGVLGWHTTIPPPTTHPCQWAQPNIFTFKWMYIHKCLYTIDDWFHHVPHDSRSGSMLPHTHTKCMARYSECGERNIGPPDSALATIMHLLLIRLGIIIIHVVDLDWGAWAAWTNATQPRSCNLFVCCWPLSLFGYLTISSTHPVTTL